MVFARIGLFVALMIFVGGLESVCAQVSLAPEDAERLLAEKVDPTYPTIARMMKLQGSVKLEITVSAAGEVTAARMLTGDAALKTAALDAAKKRRYKPYVLGGAAVPFTTNIEIRFSLGIPQEQYELDRRIGEQFFKEESLCRELVRKKQWSEAEVSCRRTISLARQFPYERELEKFGAYELFGMALVGLKRYRDAIESYNHALDAVRTKLTEQDAELGRLYGDIAIAYHFLNDLDRAREFYRLAEKTYRLAHANIGKGDVDEEIERMKQGYLKSLKNLLKLHLQAAEEAGDSAEAEKIRASIQELS
jgi:TonB family protein